jgi:peptidoglycan/LPS O-acetylase OafA/YrhL
MTTARDRQIPALTAMRGLAALAIVLFHALAAFQVGPAILDRAQVLKVAVTFFFVLSGFILTLGWENAGLGTFWRRRVARLVPVYLFTWIITLAGRSLLHWVPTQQDLLATLLFVQAWLPRPGLAMAVNPVAWSLSCEIAFYLALPLVAGRVHAASDRSLRFATGGACAWTAAGALASLRFPIEWWPGYRASEFALGVCLAAWVARGWRPGAATLRLAVAAALSLGLAVATGHTPPSTIASLWAMPAFAWAITAAAAGSAGFRGSLWMASGPQALGRWSYSLYLSHWITVVLISRFVVGAVWIGPTILACVVVSAAIYVCLERPAEWKIRHIDFRQRALRVSPFDAA